MRALTLALPTLALVAALVVRPAATHGWPQFQEGRWGPRPYPIEVATAVAVCMGESSLAGGAFGVAGGVNGAYITSGDQPIVYVTRDEVNPELTPWFHRRQGESMALVILHAGRRTHLAVADCYESLFPVISP